MAGLRNRSFGFNESNLFTFDGSICISQGCTVHRHAFQQLNHKQAGFGNIFSRARSPDNVVAIQTAVNQCRLVSRKTRNKINFWTGGKILDWGQNKAWDWRETIEKLESEVGLLLGFVYVTIISITLVSFKTKKPEHTWLG